MQHTYFKFIRLTARKCSSRFRDDKIVYHFVITWIHKQIFISLNIFYDILAFCYHYS